ncbi:MAG: RHS repeat-associated core domain-containing protein, partial [Acidobacteriota bacterium]
ERSVAGAATQTLHRHIHSRRPANSAGLRYIAFNAADNRLSGTSYDASGNLTTDLTGRSFAYEAENRQVSYNGGSVTVNASYDYDGEGRRVRRIQNGVTTVFVSNAQGQLAAEYSTQAAGGPGGTSYVMGDHLGSTRLLTKADGTVRGRHDYLPFGEEIGTSYGGRSAIAGYGAIDLRQKFTAKERDTESYLDYFIARHHSPAQGRFTSVDPGNISGLIHMDDPQSWNGYSYVRNNPLTFIDPDGLDYTVCEVDSNGKRFNCGTVTNDKEFEKYARSQGWYIKGGSLYDETGNQIGTANWFDGDRQRGDIAGAQFLVNQTAPVVETLAAATLAFVGGAMVVEAAPLAVSGARTALQYAATKVTNPDLQRALRQIYRPQDLLPWGTAGKILDNLRTGEWLSDAGHFIKAAERIRNIENIIAKGNLSPVDLAVAKAVIRDLKNVLGR